jgi:hypothetical protein
VDTFKKIFGEGGVKSQVGGQKEAVTNHSVPPLSLVDGESLAAFDSGYLARELHATRKKAQQLMVNGINLSP